MKIVREQLYEKFADDSDPIADMGIGMDKLIHDFMKNDVEEYYYDEDAETTNKDILLRYCVAYNKEDFVKYLINKGADINSNSVNSLFKSACRYGDVDTVSLAIKNGFNFHGNPKEGHEKGLRIAIEHNMLPVVKILIEAGADPEVLNGKPIRIAIANNRMEILKYLKEKDAKVITSENFKLANKYKIRAMTDYIGQELRAEKKRKIRKFFHLKENLYEKFSEESDPIVDMGIGKINIHEHIRELFKEDKNFNRVYEFLSSLIGRSITGYFRKGHNGLVNSAAYEYTFMITRYSLNKKQKTVMFEDDKGFEYYTMWERSYTYHIS